MSLDADHLDAFWAVTQTGGFSRAAETLFITQSAVTQRIRALEAALGTQLFVRAGRGVALTAAGQLLSHHCRQQREAEQALLSRLHGDGHGLVGRLAVASGSAVGRACLVPLLAELGRVHPELDLAIAMAEEQDPIALLESCQVEAVVGEIAVRRRGIRSIRLGALAFGLVAHPALDPAWTECPTGPQLRARRAIDFRTTDRVTLDHLALCMPEEDFSTLRRYFVDDDFGILDWVLAGSGFSVLPMLLAAPYVDAGRLKLYYPTVFSIRPLYLSMPEGVAGSGLEWLASRLQKALGQLPTSGRESSHIPSRIES